MASTSGKRCIIMFYLITCLFDNKFLNANLNSKRRIGMQENVNVVIPQRKPSIRNHYGQLRIYITKGSTNLLHNFLPFLSSSLVLL